MTNSELRAYLKEVAGLEQDLYTLEETKSALEAQKKPTPKPRQLEKPCLPNVDEREISNEGAGLFGIFGLVIGLAVSIPLFHWWALLLGPVLAGFSTLLFGQIPAAISKSELMSEKRKNYDEALASYEKAVAEEPQRFAREKAEIERFNAVIDAQLDALRDSINKTRTALDRLYALNIIFPKYRAIIPVTMFYEYLETGRCEELAGAVGAYNKYEEELRMELIIGELRGVKRVLTSIRGQLGQLSAQAERLQQNQYLLFQSMQESNRQIGNISRSAASLAQSNAAIANNTAWTAYSAASAARSAKAIAHATEFEHNQRYITI